MTLPTLKDVAQDVLRAWDIYINRPEPADWQCAYDWAALKIHLEQLRKVSDAPTLTRYQVAGL